MEKILTGSQLQERCHKVSIAAEAKEASKEQRRESRLDNFFDEEAFLEELEDFLNAKNDEGMSASLIEKLLFAKGWVFKPGVSYLFTKITGTDLRDLITAEKLAAAERATARRNRSS